MLQSYRRNTPLRTAPNIYTIYVHKIGNPRIFNVLRQNVLRVLFIWIRPATTASTESTRLDSSTPLWALCSSQYHQQGDYWSRERPLARQNYYSQWWLSDCLGWCWRALFRLFRSSVHAYLFKGVFHRIHRGRIRLQRNKKGSKRLVMISENARFTQDSFSWVQ